MTARSSHRPRIAVAACFHETNTFARRRTDVDDFAARHGWLRGDDLIDHFRDTRTVMGGMIDSAAEHGLELVPIVGAFATPAGLVTAGAFARISEDLTGGLAAAGELDGVLLELHGAMVVDGEPDPETTLLRHVRGIVGRRPIAVVTDLHANLTPERVALVDALVGYRTNPHVDTYQRGRDAATHINALVRGRLRTVLRHRRVPVLAAPIAQRTADRPLHDLLADARDLEKRHGLVDVTVAGGYAYADVPHAGMSFTVTAPVGAEAAADTALQALARRAWEQRDLFAVSLPGPEVAVREAAALAAQRGGPVGVADTGDNINGGSPGDTTWLLHAATIRPELRVATTLADPASVAAAVSAGVGGRFNAELGGKAEPTSGEPVRGEATVRWIGDGTFVNTGPMARGARVNMGHTAVVRIGNADIILQSSAVQPNDPAMFRAVGLDPADYQLVLLKGAAALGAGWSPITSGFIDAGTPGVTDADLRRLPYRHATSWPLDPNPTRDRS